MPIVSSSSLTTLLAPIVKTALEVLQIKDITDATPTTDPVMLYCAKSAYTQICSYLNRDLVSDQYIELYTDYYNEIKLRNTPLVSVTEVKDLNDEVLVLGTDYKVSNGRIYILKQAYESASSDFLTASSDDATIDDGLVVTYLGGYDTFVEDARIEQALLQQTIANYNRKDHLGVLSVSGGTGSGNVIMGSYRTQDLDLLLNSVKEILAPLVYYGSAAEI